MRIKKLGLDKQIILFSLLAFWLLCLMEMKAIYWGGLDRATAFSFANALAFISFLVVTAFGSVLILLFFLHSSFLKKLKNGFTAHPYLRWLIFFLLSCLPAWILLYTYWGFILISPVIRVWLFSSVIFLMAFLIRGEKDNLPAFKSFLTALVVVSSVFLTANRFKEVVDYPFTLYWSEGNRFWDYSLLFGSDRYIYPSGRPIFAYIDLGRQSLWGLPFLLDNASIALMRLWNAILFTLPYFLLGYVTFYKRRTPITIVILCALWTFLFLSQGPIYTPLILVALLVILADRLPLGLRLVLVVAAGYYANLTRYSWSFAPTIWAGLLGLLQPNKASANPYRIDWAKTILSVSAGLFGGVLLPMLIPIANSSIQDNQTAILSTAQTTLQNQPLLWSRLLPNPTNPTGILPGLLLAVLPVIILNVYFYKKSGWRVNTWQALGIIGSSIVFLLTGLVASIKIGGGSNLHNLDMFLLNLLFLAGVMWRSNLHKELLDYKPEPMWINLLLIFLIAYPAASTILQSTPLHLPSKQDQQNALNAIQRNVDEAKSKGEVLFIDQRQLLTFNYIQDVPLVPEYEKKYLMDEAMSGNTELFDHFYEDLRSQRFSLIINEPIFIEYQAEEVIFGTENDTWVTWVSQPLLCFYRPLVSYNNVGVELLVPRETPLSPSTGCP